MLLDTKPYLEHSKKSGTVHSKSQKPVQNTDYDQSGRKESKHTEKNNKYVGNKTT